MEWRPSGWSVCLPLLISPCTIKSRSSLLAPAHPGGPRKRAIKRLWCGVVVYVTILSTCTFVVCRLYVSVCKDASVPVSVRHFPWQAGGRSIPWALPLWSRPHGSVHSRQAQSDSLWQEDRQLPGSHNHVCCRIILGDIFFTKSRCSLYCLVASVIGGWYQNSL